MNNKPSLEISEIFGDKLIYLDDTDISDYLYKQILESNNPLCIDTEASGLDLRRDYLCAIQIAFGDRFIVIKIAKSKSIESNRLKYPNLCALLQDKKVLKIFHFGRFDIGIMYAYFGVLCENVFCTKVASFLVRTYTDRHGLAAVIRDVLEKQIPKDRDQQCSDWAAKTLKQAQIEYAINDVKYLEDLYQKLSERLVREERSEIAEAIFKFLPHRAMLDYLGWTWDIFSHTASN